MSQGRLPEGEEPLLLACPASGLGDFEAKKALSTGLLWRLPAAGSQACVRHSARGCVQVLVPCYVTGTQELQ